jgi:3-dehydroquinate dehydratase / shikimate dehydrogenase
MKLQTERLILRHWQKSDVELLAKLNSDPRVMEYFPKMKTLDETIHDYHLLVETMEKHGWGFWAMELKDTHQFIGEVGLEFVDFEASFTPAVEIGWRIGYEFWGNGYATEGATEVLKFGFDVLNLKEVVSFTTVANQRSRHVMEKIGMKHDPDGDFDFHTFPEGHIHRRHALYRIRKKDWKTP